MKRLSEVRKYELEDAAPDLGFAIRTMREVDARNHHQPDEPHYHTYYTVIWVREAAGSHVLDFQTYPISGGHLLFIRPGQVHTVQTEADPEGEVILFTDPFLDYNGISASFIRDLRIFRAYDDNPPLEVSPALAESLQWITREMHAVYAGTHEHRYQELGALLKLLLLACHRHCTLPLDHPQETHHSRASLRAFQELVDTEYHQLHQVKQYAERLHLTAGYLNELVVKYTGRPAKEHITQRLVLEAKRLALFTDLTNKEIAYHLGFQDPSHFGKFFKQSEGMTLHQFREQHPRP